VFLEKVRHFRFLAESLLVLSGLVIFSPSMRAQSFSIEQILSAPFPSQLTASASGSRIAWVFSKKGAQNVWTAEGPAFATRQVTHYEGDTGQPLASLRLTPDGRTIVYAKGTETNGEGLSANPTAEPKQPLQQVWSADI